MAHELSGQYIVLDISCMVGHFCPWCMPCALIGATAPLASSLFLLGEQPQKCMLWVPSLSALVSFTRTSKHNQVVRLPEASDQELQHLVEERKGEEEVGWKTEAGVADQRCSFVSRGKDLRKK